MSLFTKDERVRLFALLAKGYSLKKLTQQPQRRGAFPSHTPGLVHRKRADVKHHAEPIHETRRSRRAKAEPWTPLTIKGATVGTSAFLPTLIRDPLLQAPLLQVGQARPLQEI